MKFVKVIFFIGIAIGSIRLKLYQQAFFFLELDTSIVQSILYFILLVGGNDSKGYLIQPSLTLLFFLVNFGLITHLIAGTFSQ
jgi:hypothetical protein